ncbi:FxLYD domain-containing protein [Pseudomonas solani]|uniref:FxLYD domain-containing protein n=1 Tax=Pseudomonas solani TaxID=2731552 RepID=UPI003C2BD5BD
MYQRQVKAFESFAMLRKSCLALLALVPLCALADDVKVRNLALTRSGHDSYINGTAANTSEKSFSTVTVVFDIYQGDKLVDTETFRAKGIEGGQAWRFSVPVKARKFDSYKVRTVLIDTEFSESIGAATVAPTTPTVPVQ